MPLNDSQKYAIVSGVDGLLATLWQEINRVYVKERMRTTQNKFADLEILGGLIRESYYVDKFSEVALVHDLNIACSALYIRRDTTETAFYKATIGLRRICEGSSEYLTNNLKLHEIGNALPSGEEIRELLTVKLDTISTALLNAQYHTDISSKVSYVTGLLNKDYFPELDDTKIENQK